MSDGAQFSFSRFGRSRKAPLPEFDYVLQLCPAPVIIIEAVNGAVFQGNSPALELTGYSPSEFSHLNIEILFPDWKMNRWERSIGTTDPRNLKRKDATFISVRIENWARSRDDKFVILVLSGQPSASGLPLLSTADAPWIGYKELFAGFEEQELTSALGRTLKVVQKFTNTDSLAVYFIDQDRHCYVCRSSLGNSNWLPAQLTLQDAASFHNPQIWQSNKRPTNQISRAANESKAAYVGIFPIIKENSILGILILGDGSQTPPENLISFGQAICAVMALLFQRFDLAQKSNQLEGRLASITQIEGILKDNIFEGCLVLSESLRIIEINSAAEQILGYRRSQVKDQPIDRVLIGTDSLSAALEEMQYSGGRLKPTELRLYRRSGEAFLAQLQAYPTEPSARQGVDPVLERTFHGSLILFSDLTQQEIAREQTRQLEQRAMLGEVTAVFAHEVRNPINNISTGLELISMTLPGDDPNQATITRLLQDCDRLAELMKSVLSFSRPAEYTMSTLNLEPFLLNLLERMRPRLERMNCQGMVQAEPNLPPIIGSPRALEQVFSNLINNALQAMAETGGQVVLKTQRPQADEGPSGIENNHFVEVLVIDTGPGIPQEYLDHLFQPFFTTNSGGTGLGLAIAKRIITAHRGSITVTSFPGGTVFHILLPVAR